MAAKNGHETNRAAQEEAIVVQAGRQHGVISRRQLLRLGLTPSSIRNRLRRGQLHPLHRGVYAVGTPNAGRHGRWMAAVLACGPTALRSHRSAAELWEFIPARGSTAEVSVPLTDKHRPRGVAVHRRGSLEAADRRARHGIPVTSPIRTLADVAVHLTDLELEAAVDEAVMRDLIDLERMRRALNGVHGAGRLSRLLDRQAFQLTESELERRFLRLVGRAGLPAPDTQAQVNGFRVDFFWPALGLVVETDGLRYHRTPSQRAKDRRRDQAHVAAGLITMRFTHAQVRFEPDDVARKLERVIARLLRRAAA